MSFNLDDPLAGILSDGSDDSFFDDDILGKKKQTQKKTTPIAERKSSLFGIEETERPKAAIDIEDKKASLFDFGDTKSQEIIKNPPVAAASPVPIKRTLSKDSFKIPPEIKPKEVTKSPARTKISASADKLDILSELGSEKPSVKTLEKGKSSQSILDDILGSNKPGSSQTRPTTGGKTQDFDLDSFLGKPESKSSAPSKAVAPKSNPKIQPKEDRKIKEDSGKKSGGDWLGIFQDKEEEEEEEDDTNVPSWLGVDTKKKKSTEKKQPKQTIEEPEISEPTKEIQNTIESKEPLLTEPVLPKVSANIFQGNKEDLTTESAALYLQQQESQLMVAMQLKAQEERLAAMQTRQKESQRVQREAAMAHHAQLDAMLHRQGEQRLQMQAIISAHQQRISQRIKDLLGTVENEDTFATTDDFEGNRPENKESPYNREKKQLLQLVQSLQDNHDKEIDLMETSYRRQLAFLEVSLNQAEERMKEETDKLVRFYSEKIHWLEEHHLLYKKMTEDNMNSLSERHKAENEMIRQQHLDNVGVLQEHHVALMENIKNAVKQEQVLIQNSASFSTELHELVTDVKENRTHCQQLVDKVDKIVENNQKDNEKSLQVRETQINDMIQQLKKEREQFDIEKTESREIVKMLESRLKQMTTTIEEETAALKQRKMEFEFEKATFGKQTEFARNLLKKQDEEIKTLREDIEKEYREKIAKIEEEKSKILKESAILAKEKASTQSLKQDVEKIKAELQAQLEEVTEERSKLNVEKQQLHLEEQRTMSKSRDYDLLAKTTVDKQSQADKKYAEAEFLQRKYEERIRRVQEHVVSLNAREKQIAREKVTLSRERLSLHNERKQIEGRQQCSLCKSTQNIPEYMRSVPEYTPYTGAPESYMNVSVSRDYRTNVDTAMNNIERDIASLVSRNYSLRHSTEVGNSIGEPKYHSGETGVTDMESYKELMDPKFMMLRLDVQKVLSNLDHTKKNDDNNLEEHDKIDG